MWTVT